MAERQITLGDAIRKVTLHVQVDLQNTLLLMRGQEPELRTTELKHFLQRSRKKMLQVYALCKWLAAPGISQCFNALTDFNGQLSTMEFEMARNLDEMYFCHASIFTMRSRGYEVSTAVDIASQETYSLLPSSMFSCGKPEFPALLDADTVKKDLNMYLHVKTDRCPYMRKNLNISTNIVLHRHFLRR